MFTNQATIGIQARDPRVTRLATIALSKKGATDLKGGCEGLVLEATNMTYAHAASKTLISELI